MDKPWKICLVLLGIFAAGVLTGGAVAIRMARKMVAQRATPEQWAPMQLRRMAKVLDLTPEQLGALRPIMRRNMEELMRLRAEALAETRGIVERMDREIGDQLTPGQLGKFIQTNKERRERTPRGPAERDSRVLPPGDRRDGPRRLGPGDGRFRQMRERMPLLNPPEKPAEVPPERPKA